MKAKNGAWLHLTLNPSPSTEREAQPSECTTPFGLSFRRQEESGEGEERGVASPHPQSLSVDGEGSSVVGVHYAIRPVIPTPGGIWRRRRTGRG